VKKKGVARLIGGGRLGGEVAVVLFTTDGEK
jgi:hypothetical protein